MVTIAKETKTLLGGAGLLLAALLVGCGGTDPPVAATVAVLPDSVTLTASGVTTGFNAVVRDAELNALPDAEVAWSTSDPAVFTVVGNGRVATVTAVANGMGVLTATSGPASGTATVTVVQTPSRLEAVSGNNQTGPRGETLSQPLVVRVVEQTGGLIPGIVVNFSPGNSQSGSMNPSQVTTDANGEASTMWTLGSLRQQSATAEAEEYELAASFSATATADPPIPDYVFTGDTEVSRSDPLETETIEVTVSMTNLGDGTAPFELQFTADGTSAQTVTVAPIAFEDTASVTVTMGPFAEGDHSIGAVIDPDNDVEEWDEGNNTADAVSVVSLPQPQVIAFGESMTLGGTGGTIQLFRINVEEQVNQPFVLTLTGGSGDGDVFMDYDTRGGSTIGTRFQNRCYSWAGGNNERCQFYPARAGAYHLAIHAWSTFSGATLTAAAGEPSDTFDLDLTLVDDGGTTSQNDIITQVAERYASMMYLGAWNAFVTVPADQCVPGMPALSGYQLDDIGIWVVIGELDGAGNAVAMSGTCAVRGPAGGWVGNQPAAGAILLDEADIADLESDGVLEAVVTREMARALGFNPLMYGGHGFLQNPSLPNQPDADTHLNAPLVVAAFDAAGGGSYSGAKVPLENGAMEGISDNYWRASVFGDEIMTPYVTGDTQPLSRITLEALYEVHLEIDVTMADAFTLSSARTAQAHDLNKYYGIGLESYRRGPVVVLQPVGGNTREKR